MRSRCSRGARARRSPRPRPIVEIRVHGNHTTPDAEVLRLAGVAPGQPFSSIAGRRGGGTPAAERPVQERGGPQALPVDRGSQRDRARHPRRGAGRRSADEPSPGPAAPAQGAHDVAAGAGVRGRVRPHLRRACQLRGRARPPDAAVGAADVGRRAAGVRGGRAPLHARPVSRASSADAAGSRGASTRRSTWATAGPAPACAPSARWRPGCALARAARASPTCSSATIDDRLRSAGVDATLDTRRDPAFPRNAVYASAAVERLWFDQRRGQARAC